VSAEEIDEQSPQVILPPPISAIVTSLARPFPKAPRNTARDTWGWLWKDTAMRVLPFMAAAGLYARLSGKGAAAVGLKRSGWVRETLLGVGIGLPMAGLAAAFRAWVIPGYRLPTPADQALQTAFYFGLNAPAEELFWRGTVQSLTVRGLRLVPGLGRGAPVLGWALVTAVFGAYHRLGNWSWRSIAGVTAAGGLFGAMFQWSRRRSILAPILVHGFATAGFLSWGDVTLDILARRRHRARHIEA
jgi:membrane protease YdiL (CAAX protease family)